MIINIVGERAVNFNDANTGNNITGTTYYYLHEDSNVRGYMSDKMFVGSNTQSPFEVGKSYEVVYNRYGKFDLSKVKECIG